MNTPPPPPPPRPLEPVADPYNVALGAAIKKVMAEREVSVNALHLMTELSRQTIQRSIDGVRTLDMRQFDRIATALGGVHIDIVRRASEAA